MTKVASPGPWTDVSAGDWHACGTKADNTAYCWGFNEGRLGIGKADPIQATTPQQINGSWSQISAGHFHSCGLKTTGQVYCWGNNKNGRLGNGETSAIGALGAETYEFSPLPVKNGAGFQTISAKGSHTCGLKTDGTAWCWGGELNWLNLQSMFAFSLSLY
jgi:alpha-tubulin suppressor-like RCC1 family protein